MRITTDLPPPRPAENLGLTVSRGGEEGEGILSFMRLVTHAQDDGSCCVHSLPRLRQRLV